MIESADVQSARVFGGTTFAAFDMRKKEHRDAAVALHDRLVDIGFGPHSAAALFGLSELINVRPRRVLYYDACVLPHTAAGRAARFFVLHQIEADRDLRSWLGEELVVFLAEMHALAAAEGGWRSVVSITWVASRCILADARAYNVVWPGEPPPDYVMPPGSDSLGLIRVAPREPRRSTLDLCCGSGVQTLAAASYSDEVTGVDRSPRALRFARVNAIANRVDRATFLLGDTYGPVGGARFDAIVSNPPFVPWPPGDAELLFRGGGARGDDVLATILAGSVDRLDVPGSLAIVADFADIETIAVRLERWQGERRRTLMLVQRSHDLLEYAEMHAAHLPDGIEQKSEALRLFRHLTERGIATLDFGYLVQDGEPGPTQIVRTTAALQGTVADGVSAWFADRRDPARTGATGPVPAVGNTVSMSLTYQTVTPVLIVAHVEPTKAFFTSRLGFDVVAEVPHGDEIGFVMLRKDEITIMVQSHASVLADVGEDAARAIGDATSTERGAVTLFITVNDVERIVPIVADAGVIVPLRKTAYGMHEITIREPGGHAVTFASRLSAPTSPTNP